jgi:type I restriction enzyme S subunit
MDRFELPEGWQWQVLGDVAKVNLGKTPKRGDYANSGIKIVKFRDVSSAGIDWCNDEIGHVAIGSSSSTDLRYLETGDVLLTASAHSAESIGKKTCIVKEIPGNVENAAFVGELLCARANRTKVIPQWILSWFLSQTGKEAVADRVEGVHLTQGRAREIDIPIPPLSEQQRLATRIDVQISRVDAIRKAQRELETELRGILNGYYVGICADVEWKPLAEIAPQVRRPVSVEAGKSYPEVGIRSFGKGTFHKPAIAAEQLGSKRIYHIHPGDLIFNNVFGWEGAVAVVKPEDAGRVGSHRFITCVPKANVATTPFLYFHFTTGQGLHDLGDASPGGAGRNRTLGLTALSNIRVPVPGYDKQVLFARLWEKIETTRRLQTELNADIDAFVPALLAKAFRGDL